MKSAMKKILPLCAASLAMLAAPLAHAADKVRLRQELRRIQRELNADVERLGQRVKAVNIFGMPLLLLAIAAVLAWRRRNQKDFSRIGHGTL